MVWEMGNRGSERACDWPEVSQRNLAWTQHVSPQNCCPLQGGASASLSHMPVASLAMKVIGRKLGFGKRVREGDDSGRGGCQLSASSSPSRPAPIWPPAPGGRHPLSFSAPQKPSLPPLSCRSLRGSRHCLPPYTRGLSSLRWSPAPCHLALPAPCGIREAGGGLGSANGSPLPAILSPCLSHLCPPPPSPSIITPLPGQGENDIDRRPPPRGGGGARGRLLRKGSEAFLPHPLPFLILQPAPPPRRRSAHGWRSEPQRCVCV